MIIIIFNFLLLFEKETQQVRILPMENKKDLFSLRRLLSRKDTKKKIKMKMINCCRIFVRVVRVGSIIIITKTTTTTIQQIISDNKEKMLSLELLNKKTKIYNNKKNREGKKNWCLWYLSRTSMTHQGG